MIDDAALDTEADVVFVAGKAGLVDHEVAEQLTKARSSCP